LTVTLRPITVDNWFVCVELEPAEAQVQARFVASNAFSLAQASFEPWWRPTGIYAGEVMVGFVMYGTWPATGLPSYYPEVPAGVDYILRFMVDGKYQRQGYGRAAMLALIERVRQRPGAHTLSLSYDPTNEGAAAFYASIGFRPTGHMHGEEIEVVLDLLMKDDEP
jgi:diamine N-acetyltransferase